MLCEKFSIPVNSGELKMLVSVSQESYSSKRTSSSETSCARL
eukprot:SAG31_NODE_40720_length_279_cov_0.861111_2_plen_41_part_01